MLKFYFVALATLIPSQVADSTQIEIVLRIGEDVQNEIEPEYVDEVAQFCRSYLGED